MKDSRVIFTTVHLLSGICTGVQALEAATSSQCTIRLATLIILYLQMLRNCKTDSNPKCLQASTSVIYIGNTDKLGILNTFSSMYTILDN